MLGSIEKLRQVPLLATLQDSELLSLAPFTEIRAFRAGEILQHEGDRLPAALHALLSGSLRVSRLAIDGKETIFRVLGKGEIFAAPALFGNGIAPATVTAETDSETIEIQREALLDAIRVNPEIALKMLEILNRRLQRLHDTVHGLMSERAIARLARYLVTAATEGGTDTTAAGDVLRERLSYYRIARSIGITYEECVRLFRQIRTVVEYRRGGKITIKQWSVLKSLARDAETS
ncbi:Crp/Fnr family transcriptional regulator [Pannus brasiliensis CCIBt3594]|uniref:Crp/Fnr family transcriptional regulator n=1 Tax=Pannus brasiliensis CCIBt3594 TaxID=1427578 RepID=A0AAW9QPW2_9CHRO